MSGKAVAEKVVKAIDWEFLSKAVTSEAGKKQFYALKRTYDEVSNTLEEKFKVTPTQIDWAFYRKNLNPQIVDLFENAYKTLKVPEYVDNDTPAFEKKQAELLARAKVEAEFSRKEYARLEKELKLIREQKAALKNMTVDDYFKQNPEALKKIDAEIQSQNWSI